MTEFDSKQNPEIDAPLAARLIADQFPHWSDLSVERVPQDGHDNRTFRLGADMSIRVPSHPAYSQQVLTENAWLPKLAPQLPLPIPIPLALGKPGQGLPYHWSINRWLDGDIATPDRFSENPSGGPDDRLQFAKDLAQFLNSLRKADATDGPPPGDGNFHRGGNLGVYADEARSCIARLGANLDSKAATNILEEALVQTNPHPPTWLHGDVAASNLLVRSGTLCGVIDFGLMAVGDPACDTTGAWTLFEGASRRAFKENLTVNADTWIRGRGWALWKAMLQRCEAQTDTIKANTAQRVIDAILSDPN